MIIHRVLDELLRTWSHVAVLRALLDTATGFTGNEVGRVSGMDPKAALAALTRLEELGVVRRLRGGRDHIFTLNRDHYLVTKGILPLFAVEQRFPGDLASVIARSVKGNALSVVLFGSVARREELPQSDVDLCCIVKNEAQKEKVQLLLNRIDSDLLNRFGVKLAPVYFTANEFRKKAKLRNVLIRNILEQGKVISGKHPKGLLRA